jgi:CubicO group peptidase (beta-lactamase class C family)
LAGGCAADGTRIWHAETIRNALRVRTDDLTEPWFNKKAMRCLGLVIAGDDDRVYRGFAPSCSPHAFGHNGAGGQIAWADPESGVSFAYCTNGFDRNPIRQAARGVSLSERAALCARP